MKQIIDIKKERNKLLDIIKGFAIMLVVLGHSIQYGNGADFLATGAFYNEIPFKIIYSFHMPLFMLISGYFFYFTAVKYNFSKGFLGNRITKLLIPIFTWNLLTFCVYAICGINQDNSHYKILNFFISIFTNLWFLWAIFWCSIVVMLVKEFFKDNIYIYILGFIIAFIIPDVYNLALYKFMYPYFILGYLYNKNSLRLNSKISYVKPIYLLGIITILYLILFFSFNLNSYIYTSGHAIFGSYSTGNSIAEKTVIAQIYIDLYRYFIGLFGSVLVILVFSNFLKNTYNKKVEWVAKLGIESLGIYIISGLVVQVLPVISQKQTLNYFFTLLETIIIIVASYIVTKHLKRLDFTNKFLLGGR